SGLHYSAALRRRPLHPRPTRLGGALANGMPTRSKEADFRCEPAVEPTRLALLSLLDALRVGSELRVEALDVDPVVGRTIVLERRESLHEQVARTASAAALEAQMERRRH